MSGDRSLGDILRDLKREAGVGLGELTVLSSQNDPFRLDTPANHAIGKWLQDRMRDCGLLSRAKPIHNRGLHYAMVARGDVLLPSGLPYKNDDDCWSFLEKASKTARWLDYVPFDSIVDARNSEPVIRTAVNEQFRARIRVDAAIYLPTVEDLKPRVSAEGFLPRQKYKLVFFGEKTSLDGVLEPLARDYDADLYLPSGEISDTLLWRMARNGDADGREMVVLVFADCDPAGYQMAVSIGHKLRALRESLYPSLAFRVLAPALMVEQVKELGLPSTPLKETELRAAGWREKHGVEQTEIDALATLQPATLHRIVRDACTPFYDKTLSRRASIAKQEWEEAAQAMFDAHLENDDLAAIYEEATRYLEELKGRINSIDVAIDRVGVRLPGYEAPEVIIDAEQPQGLVSSDMPLIEAIRILRDRKRYGGDDGGGP